MPPAQRIEATCYVVDASSQFGERLDLLKKIFSLKFFARTMAKDADQQQIIIYNHPELKPLHIVNEFHFYNFDIFTHIEEQISEKMETDETALPFVYPLQEAIDSFKKEDFKPNYIKKIVFLTDLSEDVSCDGDIVSKAEKINRSLDSYDIWLYIIGLKIKLPEIDKYESEIPKTFNKIEPSRSLSLAEKNNFNVLSKIKNNTIYVDEKNGLHVIFSHKPRSKLPFPWYVKMNIGDDVEIPLYVYRTTRKSEIIRIKPASTVHSSEELNKSWYDVNTHQKVEKSDVVRGYKFQGKLVHLTGDLIQKFKKIEVPKCLTIFGFASIEDIPVNLLVLDDSLNCIKPDPRVPHSAADRRFALFATALRVKNCIALAYRVYNNNNQRKFFGIFPCPDHEDNSHLLMGQFPFAHEFQEGFYLGKVEEEYKSDTFHLMSDLLNKLNPYDEETDVNLYPLPPSLQVDCSRARKAEFLIKKYLEEDLGEAPSIKMNSTLEKRVLKNAKALSKELLLK